MVGNWRGTLTVETAVRGSQSGVSVCGETWVVATQIDGRFSGSFQAGGECAASGSINGTVASSGEVTGLTFSVFVGSPGETSTCRRVSGDGVYAGLLDGASLLARTVERIECVAGGAGLQFDRAFNLSMNKQ